MLLPFFRYLFAVAIRASRRAGLVKQHQFAVYGLFENVAGRAGHLLMAALERERGLLVIEERGLPFAAVVAASAVCGAYGELIGMRVFMAFSARFRGSGKLDMYHRKFHVWRLMAVDAGRRSMRSFERKLRIRVVEFFQISPAACGVTCLTSERLARCVKLRHPLGKLPLMHIFVATGATELLEVVRHQLLANGRLVALVAGHSPMPARQWPTRLLVRRQRVARALEGGPSVALFAAIEPGRGGKLPLMLVPMAIHAALELDLVAGCLPRRSVAVGALHLFVRKDQWKFAFCVIGSRVRRWLEAFHRVATLALAAIGALRKLASMRVLVAIHAARKSHRRFEVGALVAGQAWHFKVLASQGVFRL